MFIDPHRRLIVDGQPFFPLGMYWGGVKEKELGIYAKGPFNCLMPWQSDDESDGLTPCARPQGDLLDQRLLLRHTLGTCP